MTELFKLNLPIYKRLLKEVKAMCVIVGKYLDRVCEDIDEFETQEEAKNIPVPTIMVFSGNGIHVKCVYREAVSGTNLRHFERLEKKLQRHMTLRNF